MSQDPNRRETAAQAATQALADTDWAGARIEREPRTAKVVHSARIPVEYSERLEAEAERRGMTPSALICELVMAGLNEVSDDTVVTLRVSDLRRAIAGAAHRVA